VTKFTRQYPNGTVVTLTPPADVSGNVFQRWELDTVPLTSNLTTTVSMTADHTLTAAYVPVAPSFVTQPQSQTRSEGSNVVFSVTATGTAPLAYQWRRNGANLSDGPRITGACTNTLAIASLQTGDAGSYSVAITNLGGSVTSQIAVLTVIPTSSFHNTNRITINDYSPATPYPSGITVAGRAGIVKKATVTLHGLSHTWPDDLGVLLVGPKGQKITLMDEAGGSQPITGLTLTFDDDALTRLPDNDTISSGTYRPGASGSGSTFTPPAPPAPYAATLSVLQGLDPNGTWSLYVEDFAAGDLGAIVGGWSLSLLIGPPPSCPVFVPGSLRCFSNGRFECYLAGIAGSNYEIEASADLRNWKSLRSLCLTNTTGCFVDLNTNVARRFYRAKLLP
jgi:subtilisin-like proprotein convertase family protein